MPRCGLPVASAKPTTAWSKMAPSGEHSAYIFSLIYPPNPWLASWTLPVSLTARTPSRSYAYGPRPTQQARRPGRGHRALRPSTLRRRRSSWRRSHLELEVVELFAQRLAKLQALGYL